MGHAFAHKGGFASQLLSSPKADAPSTPVNEPVNRQSYDNNATDTKSPAESPKTLQKPVADGSSSTAQGTLLGG